MNTDTILQRKNSKGGNNKAMIKRGVRFFVRKGRRITAVLLAFVCAAALAVSPVQADTHREFEYDIDTPWTNDDVQEMLDYATYWVGKIDYASAQNNTDPHHQSHEELYDGGKTDCSWFVYHVLFRFGLLNHFVHSYEWGNRPGEYPGGHNIGRDLSNAVPGDILCTGEGTKSQNSHVLIYLGGDKVVHCAAGHGVIISDAPNHPRQIVHFSCIPTHQTDKAVDTQ